MNCMKSFRHAVFFAAALTFRCANASSSRQQRVPLMPDPPAAVATMNFAGVLDPLAAGSGSGENVALLNAIVAFPFAAALIGVGVRIFAEEWLGAGSYPPELSGGAIHTHQPNAIRVTLRPKE